MKLIRYISRIKSLVTLGATILTLTLWLITHQFTLHALSNAVILAGRDHLLLARLTYLLIIVAWLLLALTVYAISRYTIHLITKESI